MNEGIDQVARFAFCGPLYRLGIAEQGRSGTGRDGTRSTLKGSGFGGKGLGSLALNDRRGPRQAGEGDSFDTSEMAKLDAMLGP